MGSEFGTLPVLLGNFYRQVTKLGVGATIDPTPVVDTKIDGS